jgi:hypothetical protein
MFVTHDSPKNFRLTRDELITHLANSGDDFPESSVSVLAGTRGEINTHGGGVTADAGFYWVRTCTLRVPYWEGA